MTTTRITERVVPGQRLGRHQNHDPRSLPYRYKARTAGTLQTVSHPPSIPCLDQGDVGSCVGNTFTELLSTREFADVARGLVLDETFAQDFYSDCTKADTYPGTWRPDDTGTDGTTAGNVAVARGLAAGFQHAMDSDSFAAAVQKHAVPIGIKWRSGMDTPDTAGVVRYRGAVRGGHELLVVGYNATAGQYELQNHWTAEWGVGGRCWITAADLYSALADDGDATIVIPGTEPAPVPTPAVNPDAADDDFWAASKTWLASRRLGANATEQQLLRAWGRSRGYSS